RALRRDGMANTIDRELFDRLRASGLRKRVARVISEATGAGRDAGGRAEQTARKAIKDLRGLADEIEDRLRGTTQKSSRSEAAKKGAQTRARQASTRSEAAKKAARTRAAKATSGSSRSSGGTTRAKATSGSSRSS